MTSSRLREMLQFSVFTQKLSSESLLIRENHSAFSSFQTILQKQNSFFFFFLFQFSATQQETVSGSGAATGFQSGCEIKASTLRQSYGQNVAYVNLTRHQQHSLLSPPTPSLMLGKNTTQTGYTVSQHWLCAPSSTPQPHRHAFFFLYIYHIYSYICIRMPILEMETTLDISRQLNDTNPPAQIVTTCGVGISEMGERSKVTTTEGHAARRQQPG